MQNKLGATLFNSCLVVLAANQAMISIRLRNVFSIALYCFALACSANTLVDLRSVRSARLKIKKK
jgi:hypothetical protein